MKKVEVAWASQVNAYVILARDAHRLPRVLRGLFADLVELTLRTPLVAKGLANRDYRSTFRSSTYPSIPQGVTPSQLSRLLLLWPDYADHQATDVEAI